MCTYQEVFQAANTSTHTLRDTRIKRIYITNWGDNNELILIVVMR